MILTRRKLIGGLATFIAAPAIIRVADIMRIKPQPTGLFGLQFEEGTAAYGYLPVRGILIDPAVVNSVMWIPRRLSNEELMRLTQ